MQKEEDRKESKMEDNEGMKNENKKADEIVISFVEEGSSKNPSSEQDVEHFEMKEVLRKTRKGLLKDFGRSNEV